MNKKKKVFENDFNVTEEQMDSLARVLFPLVYDYLTSEKGAENDKDTYVKKNGEYFLYCRGGSKSEWSICKNNKVLSGQYIIPIMNPKFEEWVTLNAMLIDSMMHLSGVK
ncbi:MAG: hypothetical protein E7605_02830 [Ruminococcaceae bacterium]|nr:hypothetical protein [Oscillospiraceae bacterium]